MKASHAAKTKKLKKKRSPLFYAGLGALLALGAVIEIAVIWFFVRFYSPTYTLEIQNDLSRTVRLEECGESMMPLFPDMTAVIRDVYNYQDDKFCRVYDDKTKDFLGCLEIPMGFGSETMQVTLDKNSLETNKISCVLRSGLRTRHQFTAN